MTFVKDQLTLKHKQEVEGLREEVKSSTAKILQQAKSIETQIREYEQVSMELNHTKTVLLSHTQAKEEHTNEHL